MSLTFVKQIRRSVVANHSYHILGSNAGQAKVDRRVRPMIWDYREGLTAMSGVIPKMWYAPSTDGIVKCLM